MNIQKKNEFSKFFFNYKEWESELSPKFLNYSLTVFLLGVVVFSVESTPIIPSFFIVRLILRLKTIYFQPYRQFVTIFLRLNQVTGLPKSSFCFDLSLLSKFDNIVQFHAKEFKEASLNSSGLLTSTEKEICFKTYQVLKTVIFVLFLPDLFFLICFFYQMLNFALSIFLINSTFSQTLISLICFLFSLFWKLFPLLYYPLLFRLSFETYKDKAFVLKKNKSEKQTISLAFITQSSVLCIIEEPVSLSIIEAPVFDIC